MVNLEIITFMENYKYIHKLTCTVRCCILKDSFKLMFEYVHCQQYPPGK